MIGDRVERIAVAPAGSGRRIGCRSHLLVEHPVAKCLHGVDLRLGGGNSHAKGAGAEFGKGQDFGPGGSEFLLHRHRSALPCTMAGLAAGVRLGPALTARPVGEPDCWPVPTDLRRMLPPCPAASRHRRVTPAAEQLQTQRDQVEAEPLGNRLHQPLVFGVLKLDDLAGIDVDQVIVVAVFGRFVARAAAAEVAPFEDALLLQQTHRPVDGGDGDAGIERRGPAIQLLHVGMVGSLGQDAGDDATLPGHLEASFDAQALDAQFHRIPCDQPSRLVGHPGQPPEMRNRGVSGPPEPSRSGQWSAGMQRRSRSGSDLSNVAAQAATRPEEGCRRRSLRGLVPRPLFLASEERCLA